MHIILRNKIVRNIQQKASYPRYWWCRIWNCSHFRNAQE